MYIYVFPQIDTSCYPKLSCILRICFDTIVPSSRFFVYTQNHSGLKWYIAATFCLWTFWEFFHFGAFICDGKESTHTVLLKKFVLRVHIYIYIYMYTYIYMHIYIYIYMHIYICINIYTSTSVYTYIYIYIYLHTYMCIYVYAHIYMHVNMFKYVQAQRV